MITIIKKEIKISKEFNTSKDINEILDNLKPTKFNIMSHFYKRICYDKDENYKIVSNDLYKNGIFDDNDNEIANNIYKKVKTVDEINSSKNNKKKNDTRF